MRQPRNRLTYLRLIKFMSQKDVATKLGISAPYYCKLERNPDKIDLGMAGKLKTILGVASIDELVQDAV